MKKPNPLIAYLMSVAATLDLFAFVLMAAGDNHGLPLIVMGVCVVVLILLSVSTWKMYFERLMDCRIRQDNQPA